jgi:hypothetical protein
METSSLQTEHSLKIGALSRKRSFWRGVGAGFVAKWLTFFTLICIVYVIRPFIWPIVYDVPYAPDKNPLVPGSGEWFFIQIIGFLCAFAGGFAAAYWSKAGSWSAVGALAILALVFSIFWLPQSTSTLILIIWFLEMPLGILLGGFLYITNERKT